MLPGDVLGLIVILAAVAPGYVFVRAAERYRPRPDRSALLETTEVVAIGAACTTVAVIAVVAVGEVVDGIAVNLAQWSSEGAAYVRSRPYRTIRSAGLVLGGASGLAYLAARFIHRGRPPDIIPGVTVRAGVLEPAGRPDRRAWVAVHLRDGSVVEGYLLAHPTGGSDVQDLALQKPIARTVPNGPRTLVPGVDRVIVAADEIAMIGVRLETSDSHRD